MMNIALRNIFVRVISRRVKRENRTSEDIIAEYVKLTEEEKAEILQAI